MERSRQIDRDDRIPAFFRELDDLRDMLDPGIVDENVDTAELPHRFRGEFTYFRRFGHVGRRIGDAYAVLLGKGDSQPLDRGRVAEAVQHDIATLDGERRRDAEPDPAGR